MNNLYLPGVDLSTTPDLFNYEEYDYYSLTNSKIETYAFKKQLFSLEECKEIIKLGRSFKIEESSTASHKGFSEVRSSKNSWLRPGKLTSWIYQKIDPCIRNINDNYFGFDLHALEALQFTEYDESYKGCYVAHVDTLGNEVSPNSFRKLSFSILLNDPNTYEGGDFLLYSDSIQRPVVFPKDTGTAFFFPSTTLHEVTPVTKGVRYSLVGWCRGPKFK